MLKRKSCVENKVVDALNRIGFLLHTTRVKVLGFDRLKDSYSSCPNFGLIHSELLAGNRRPNVDFVLPDSYLFRSSRLCIP